MKKYIPSIIMAGLVATGLIAGQLSYTTTEVQDALDAVATNTSGISTNAADILSLEANAISSNLWTSVRDSATNGYSTAMDITNTFYTTDSAGTTVVTNAQVFLYGRLQSWTTNGVSL